MGRAVLLVRATDGNYRFIANYASTLRNRRRLTKQAGLFAAGLVLALGAEIIGVVALVGGIPKREWVFHAVIVEAVGGRQEYGIALVVRHCRRIGGWVRSCACVPSYHLLLFWPIDSAQCRPRRWRDWPPPTQVARNTVAASRR